MRSKIIKMKKISRNHKIVKMNIHMQQQVLNFQNGKLEIKINKIAMKHHFFLPHLMLMAQSKFINFHHMKN